MPVLEGGERIERYIGDHWAQIDHGGSSRDTVVRSFTPLRVRDQAGEMVAVDLDLEDRGEVLSPASSPSPVEVADRGAKVTLGGSGLALTPTGTDAAQVDGALSAGRGHFTSVATDTDYVVVPMATGVELSWVLRSDRAPETLALELDLPAGTSLREAPVGGPGGLSAPALPARRVELVKDEKVIAAIEPPHAVDADGTEVDVAMAVRDGRLVLDVAHRERDYRFPILVDPVVNDYLSWKEVPGYHDPSVTYNGWSHQQGGCYASACGAVYGYAGSSYHGSGLYAWGQEGHFFTGGRYSQWVWQAPGDAYIYRADFGWAHHDVANSNLYEGIYSVTRGQWENVDISVPPAPGYSIGRYQPYIEPNYLDYDFKTHCQQPCGWGSPGAPAGTPGNIMAFGVQMRSSGSVGGRPMAYLGGATVRLHEFNPPYGSTDGGSYSTDGGIDTTDGGSYSSDGGSYYPHHTGLSEGWVRHANIQSEVAAYDNGLGVKAINLTSPTGWTNNATEDSCNGARANTQDRPCPSYTTRTFNYDTSTMPEGIVPINATARDIVGNQGDVASWQVKIDRTPPTGSISGIDEGELARDRDYTITGTGTDPLSGAKSVAIELDGVQRARRDDCPSSSTPCSLSWSLDGGDRALSEGVHTLRSITTDHADNTSTSSARTFRVERMSPDVLTEGTLKPEDRPWVPRGQQSLLVDAEDAETGVVSARIEVGGRVVKDGETTQACPPGDECPLVHDFVIDTDDTDPAEGSQPLKDGSHDAELVVRDGAGNERRIPWTFRQERTPPELNVAGPLVQADGQLLAPNRTYRLDATATDSALSPSQSGLGSIDFGVDEEPPQGEGERECQGEGSTCPLTRRYEYNTSDYADGQHTITVVATDRAGNQTTKTVTIKDPLDPRPSCAAPPIPTVAMNADPAASTFALETFRSDLGVPEAFAPSTFLDLKPVALQPVLRGEPDRLVASGVLGSAAVDRNAADGATITVDGGEDSGGPICLTPTTVASDAQAPTDPALANSVATVFANSHPSTDTAIRPSATGADALLQLRTAVAPRQFSWHVALRPGLALKSLGDTVAVVRLAEPGTPAPRMSGLPGSPTVEELKRAFADTALHLRHAEEGLMRAQSSTGDEVVAVFRKPWAKDALGRPVATSLSHSGSTIGMTVSHAAADAFPVIASLALSEATATNTGFGSKLAAETIPRTAADEASADESAPPTTGASASQPPPGGQTQAPEDTSLGGDFPDVGSAADIEFSDSAVLDPDVARPGDSTTAVPAVARRDRLERLQIGLTESDPATINEDPDGRRLRPCSPTLDRCLRPFVYWNIVELIDRYEGRKQPPLTEDCERRAARNWIEYRDQISKKPATERLGVLVTFILKKDPSTRCPFEQAPDAPTFAKAMDKFISDGAHSFVRRIEPLNEPDLTRNETSNRPRLAADYWIAVNERCSRRLTPTSTKRACEPPVAGGFVGRADDKRGPSYKAGYKETYRRRLDSKGLRPKVWSFHAWADVRDFELNRTKDFKTPKVIEFFRRLFARPAYQDSNGNAPQVWITEVGSDYRMSCKQIKQTRFDETRRKTRARLCNDLGNGGQDEYGDGQDTYQCGTAEAPQTCKRDISLRVGTLIQRNGGAFLMRSVSNPIPKFPSRPIARLYYYALQDQLGKPYPPAETGGGKTIYGGRCFDRAFEVCPSADSGLIGNQFKDDSPNEQGRTVIQYSGTKVRPLGRSQPDVPNPVFCVVRRPESNTTQRLRVPKCTR